MATISKRLSKKGVPRYRVEVRLCGQVQTHTFGKVTDAKRWAEKTEVAIREGRSFGHGSKVTLGELIDKYATEVLTRADKAKSRDDMLAKLDRWKELLGRRTLASIGPAEVSEAINALATEGVPRLISKANPKGLRSNGTVNRYVAALSVVYSQGIHAWQMVDRSPVTKRLKRPEPQGRTRTLSVEERVRLLDACKESRNPYLYPITMLALATGMRRGEILGLRWQYVDRAQRAIVLPTTKNGEPRRIPLSDGVLEVLTELGRSRRLDTDLLFPRDNENRPSDIQSAWDKAVLRAKLTGFKFHDLRHTAASLFLESGASLVELSALLGHRSLQMVKRYAHMSAGHAATIVQRMNARLFSPPAAAQAEGT